MVTNPATAAATEEEEVVYTIVGGQQEQLELLARQLWDVFTELQRAPRAPQDSSIVTIIAGAELRRIRMHRQILISRVPFFQRLYRFNRTIHQQPGVEPGAYGAYPPVADPTTVRLPELDGRSVSALCKYAYTGKLMLMPDSIVQTVYAAHFLGMTQVRRDESAQDAADAQTLRTRATTPAPDMAPLPTPQRPVSSRSSVSRRTSRRTTSSTCGTSPTPSTPPRSPRSAAPSRSRSLARLRAARACARSTCPISVTPSRACRGLHTQDGTSFTSCARAALGSACLARARALLRI